MNAAYDDSVDESSPEERRSRRLRFELIFASLGLAFGLFLLPALIYWVGAALLGAYGEKAGLSTFYVDFYGDLADGAGRAWILALGPLVLVYVLRAVFIGAGPKASETVDTDDDLRTSRGDRFRRRAEKHHLQLAKEKAPRRDPRASSHGSD